MRTMALTVAALIGLLFTSVAPVDAKSPKCPKAKGDTNFYAIGSSTMGDLLGPMLKGELKRRWKIEGRKWGKASTGLARPDFHDWLGEVPKLNRKYDPELYIISLGTNDAQPLRTTNGGWVRKENPKWEEIYAARVDKMLGLLAGKDKRRKIIWLGPTAFKAKNSRKMGPIITRIIRERIAAFKGDATFIDAYVATRPKKGQYVKNVTSKKNGKTYKAFGHDGIHLSREGVRWLLVEPVLELLRPCYGTVTDR